MKILLAALLSALCMPANATPSADVVDACLHTESPSSKIRYTLIETAGFDVIEDEDARKTATVLHHGKDTFGTWERQKPPVFGLIFNGKETPLTRVIRLSKRDIPITFNPYEAMWGMADDGKTSYICATFNFEGLGKSGSFQNVRGVYLIERSKRSMTTFYTAGDISLHK